MSTPVVQWISRKLTKLLNIEANEDVARYILAIESEKEVEEYLSELLDPNIPKNRKFINELLKKYVPPRQIKHPKDATIYRKADKTDQTYINGNKLEKNKWKENHEHSKPVSNVKENFQNGITLENPKTSDVRRKVKYTPLFDEKGISKTVSMLPGRHICECQASKHSLVNNCTECGRIICNQEGSGPCLFCGALVCSKEEMEILNRGSKKSEKLREQLMNVDLSSKSTQALEKAILHKNRLLEYDKNSTQRTKVIDDESDYFSVDKNLWLDKDKKEALQRREDELRSERFSSRRDRKVKLNFDFAGRFVEEESTKKDMYSSADKTVNEIYQGSSSNKQKNSLLDEETETISNPNLDRPPPKFIGENAVDYLPIENGENNKPVETHQNRIQDRELQEMSDTGMCLSMHQPWASLLVSGIKKHEGRSWYSAVRGRLWIAATAKEADTSQIESLETEYKHLYQDSSLKFPTSYPTACLLGCVEVTHCLEQTVYREMFPDGESQSEYVFICENPQQLLIKFPIKGRHKIYKLETQLHQSAKKGLRKS